MLMSDVRGFSLGSFCSDVTNKRHGAAALHDLADEAARCNSRQRPKERRRPIDGAREKPQVRGPNACAKREGAFEELLNCTEGRSSAHFNSTQRRV